MKKPTGKKKPTKKTGKKINWPIYNRMLKNRVSLTVWFSKDVVNSWYNVSEVSQKGRGFQRIYSDTAIEVLSLIRFQFHLTLRSLEGFATSLMEIMKITDLCVPDYTTLSRRLEKCEIKIRKKRKSGKVKSGENIHVVVDSTGLKVFGEGEWKVRQHGYTKRRTWRKIHLCVDESSNEIIGACLTDNSFKDNEVLPGMLKENKKGIVRISGDGAYDASNCWNFCQSNGIEGVFPPRKGARIKRHGNCAGPPLQRDEHIRMIRRGGKKRWKGESGYSRRSIAETAMYRIKALFGERILSRRFANQANEVFLKCQLLNMMSTPKVL